MPSMMKPKVKVGKDSRPSAGTRIKTGGTDDVPVRVKALPEPKVARGAVGDMKAPPMGNHMVDSAHAYSGDDLHGGDRNEIEPDYGDPMERMPPMMSGDSPMYSGPRGGVNSFNPEILRAYILSLSPNGVEGRSGGKPQQSPSLSAAPRKYKKKKKKVAPAAPKEGYVGIMSGGA